LKAEYINPVIQGAQTILAQLVGEKATMGKVSIKKSISEDGLEIVIVIGLVGELKGYAMFVMDHDTGHFLASKFMEGMPDNMVEELLSSAVSEITNMVSGKISALYCDIGIKSDISPPQFTEPPPGGFFKFLPNGAQVVCIPLTFECGRSLEIELCFA
jgi:chemotaxis protein CheX